MKNNIEILAPVGSMESLYAAVKNGADAVYLGGKLFNARQYASNFDDEELKNAVRFAHLSGVKVYVTMNILLSNEEIKEAIKYIEYLYSIDVDALIVQDLGLASLVKKAFPDFELHASTQMTINNYQGVKFLEDNGFKRAVLAREVSIDEIKEISEKTNVELEGFIHGALCVSYSGQCLMSSFIGQRSGNRGRCAQPCRMTYTLVNLDTKREVNKESNNKYILSLKDLITIDRIKDVIDSGIVSLKIEGRMKRPEYVAIIVDKYKAAIEACLQGNHREVPKKDIKEMTQIFNRGFTKGFILNEKSADIGSYDRANNKGVVLGVVTDVRRNKSITIKLQEDLHMGDGIQFVLFGTENTGMQINKMYLKGKLCDKASRGKLVQIPYVPNVEKGNVVMKTSDRLLNEKAALTYKNVKFDKVNELNIFVDLRKGKKPVLTASDNNGNYITVESDFVIEEARNKPTTQEIIIKQLSKTGNSTFKVANIDISMDDNIIIPVSKLNEIRRKAVDALEDMNADYNKRKDATNTKIDDGIFVLESDHGDVSSKLSISVQNEFQLKQLDMKKIDRLYIKYFSGINKYMQDLKENEVEVYLKTDKIISNSDIDKLLEKADSIENLDGISTSNYGTLELLRGSKYKIHCDESFNAFNNYTLDNLVANGANGVTLSTELTLEQVKEITGKTNNKIETVVYGYAPVMVTKFCPVSKFTKCNEENCTKCINKKKLGLRDRVGKIFPMVRGNKVTTIYNSEPLFVLDYLEDLKDNFIDYMRLDFTIEEDNIREIQSIYFDYLNGDVNREDVRRYIKSLRDKGVEITKGHYFRGVL